MNPSPARDALVLGLGTAGGAIVRSLSAVHPPGLRYAVLDTDPAMLNGEEPAAALFLGAALTRGLGARGDADLARTSAEEDAARLRPMLAGTSHVLLVAGLGGGCAAGVAPVVARLAHEAGAMVLAFVTLPFSYEGSRRVQQAGLALNRLRHRCAGVLALPNDRATDLLDARTSLLGAFALTANLAADAAAMVWGLLSRPGQLPLSAADLVGVLGAGDGTGAFARAEDEGPNRAAVVVEKLLAQPLLRGGQTLRECAAVLVSVEGPPDLPFFEFRLVSERLREFCPQAQFVAGASLQPGGPARLTVSVITAGQAAAAPPAAEGDDLAARISEPRGEAAGTRRELLPPAPDLTPETVQRLPAMRNGKRKPPQQGQLPLDTPGTLVARSRFAGAQPTKRRGQDLDQPTYYRRGICLN